MKQWLKKVVHCGFPQNIEQELLDKILFFNVIVVVYILTAVPFSIVHLIRKNYLLCFCLVIGLVLLIGMRLFLCNTKKYQITFLSAAILMTFIYLSNYITGGTDNHGPLWYFTFPMMALILLGLFKGGLLSIALIIISLLLLVKPFNQLMMTAYEPSFLVRFFISYIIVFILAFIYEFQKQRSGKEIKILKKFLPICSNCKKIRDDKGYWEQVDVYIQKHSDTLFSHSICPECTEKLYGNEDWYIEMKKEKSQKE